VQAERERLAERQAQLERIRENLARLS